MNQPSIQIRYNSVFKRSFERHMDLFLTTQYLQFGHFAEASTDAYRAFDPTSAHWSNYLRSHQAKSLGAVIGGIHTVGELDVAIKGWWERNKGALDPYRAVHTEREFCISLAGFQEIFITPSNELACAYCYITEAEFKQLVDRGQVQTKRLRTRGTTFELDCRVPELGYKAGNVVVCCYWCNNAKSDEFSPEEFQPVADALARVWQERLGS